MYLETFPAPGQCHALAVGLVALITRQGGGQAAARWSSGTRVTRDSWEHEGIDLRPWHGFGAEIWKPRPSPWLVAVRDTYCIILVIFCGWSRAEAFLGSNRTHGQGQAGKQGSCQENSGWSGLSARAGSL